MTRGSCSSCTGSSPVNRPIWRNRAGTSCKARFTAGGTDQLAARIAAIVAAAAD